MTIDYQRISCLASCLMSPCTWDKDKMAGPSKERFERSLGLRREDGLGWHRTGLDGEVAVRLG